MKKNFLISVMLLVFSSPLHAEVIGGFWGVNFGDSLPQAQKVMEANGAVPVFDSYDYRLGRTMLWRGTFFNKPCLIQMWFGDQGLWRSQASFKTPEGGTSPEEDLEKLLTAKYGTPKVNNRADAQVRNWKTYQKTLDLTAAPKSSSTGYDTVLTYTDKARSPK